MVTGKVSDGAAGGNAARHNGVSPRASGPAKQAAPAGGTGSDHGVIDPSNWLQGLVILPPIAQITADTRPAQHDKAAARTASQRSPAGDAAGPNAQASADPHTQSPALPPVAASSPFAVSNDPADQRALAASAGDAGDETAAAAVAQLALRAGDPSSRDSEAESSMVSEELDSRTSSVSSATGSLTSAGRSGSPGWPPLGSSDRGPAAGGPANSDAPLRPGTVVRADAEPGPVRPQKARRELAFSPDQMGRTQRHGEQVASDATEPPLSEPQHDDLDGALPGKHPPPSLPRLPPGVGSHPVDGASLSGSEEEQPEVAGTPSPTRQPQDATPVQNGMARGSVDDMPGDEDLPHGESCGSGGHAELIAMCFAPCAPALCMLLCLPSLDTHPLRHSAAMCEATADVIAGLLTETQVLKVLAERMGTPRVDTDKYGFIRQPSTPADGSVPASDSGTDSNDNSRASSGRTAEYSGRCAADLTECVKTASTPASGMLQNVLLVHPCFTPDETPAVRDANT